MRIEKVNSIQVEALTNNALSPRLTAEEKEKNDSAVKGRNIADFNKSTGYNPRYDFRKIEFYIHEKTGDVMVKVYDAETNEIIREIPPEKIKDMIANMLERAGLLVDKRA